jgi:hypothetical protein
MELPNRNKSFNDFQHLIFGEILDIDDSLQQISYSDSVTKMQFRSALKYFDIIKAFDAALEEADEFTKKHFESTFSFNQADKFIQSTAEVLNLSPLQLKLLFEVAITL